MRIYSTLSGRKEEIPLQQTALSMYICGITPYDDAHLGHAMSYIIFDVIRRYLEYKGCQVRHVQNFTDVDDKIIERAAQTGDAPQALAERYIERFHEDMASLNVRQADLYPRATEEIPAIIDVIEGLIHKGYAYTSGGDVYFRVQSFPDYGQLARRSLEGMRAGARVAVAEGKEHPLDFALWKTARPEEPFWESPWGTGRPGWHVECSAMSLKYLGETLDIHGGGQDLIFPHHQNEIAQSEGVTGVHPFARWWVHHGLMRLGEEKMSKSLGNLIPVREAVPRYGADAIRLFVLNSHYRNPLSYSEETLASMRSAAARLRRAVQDHVSGEEPALDPAPYQALFEEAMDDDFNTPQALAALFDLAREANRAAEQGRDVRGGRDILRSLCSVLGLTLEGGGREEARAVEPFVDLLVETRAELRSARQFALADHIRDRLETLHIALEDTPQGTVWHLRDRKAAD